MNNPFQLTPEEIAELEKLLDMSEYTGYGEDFGYFYGDEPPPIPGCKHDWREDRFFSSNVYYTCKKCNVKKEDL